MQVVTTAMREGINSMEWTDREEWRRKIKLKLQATERRENIDTLYINNNNNN